MTENQKLREVATELDRLMLVIESAVRHADPRNHASVMALIRANKEALALPTAAQVDDINVAESFTSAAPVGEREAFDELIEEFEAAAIDKHDCRNPEYKFEHRAYDSACQRYDEARAALSAGDAVDAQRTPLTVLQYNAIPELCAIPPSLYESVVRAIERAHGIDAAMRKGQL